jgi:hypothetical protein
MAAFSSRKNATSPSSSVHASTWWSTPESIASGSRCRMLVASSSPAERLTSRLTSAASAPNDSQAAAQIDSAPDASVAARIQASVRRGSACACEASPHAIELQEAPIISTPRGLAGPNGSGDARLGPLARG